MSIKLKKYLLPLILILCLALTLTGYSANLFSTYDQRIKLTIDNTKIDSDLTWFPVTVFLTSSQGEEVFAEFDADADFDKVAFTTSDESTQIYGDCELFDDSESKAIYHIAKTGVVTDADAAGYIYMYYDNDASANTTYISASGGTAAQSVWDGDYEAVWHMSDGTTSTTLDSTSNNNDGTKKAANEPVEATGQVGQGQDFSSDYISFSDSDDWNFGTGGFTISCLMKLDADENGALFSQATNADNRWVFHYSADESIFGIALRIGGSWTLLFRPAWTPEMDTWYHVALVRSGNDWYVYVDGTQLDTASASVTMPDLTSVAYIGTLYDPAAYTQYFNGLIDEYHIAKTGRAAAWIKATYNSLWDTLLTYGSEETGGGGTHTFFTLGDF